MNFSDLKPQIYNYLGFRGVGESETTDRLIFESLGELEKIAQFNYIYRLLDSPPDFLKKEPYASYLSGARGVIVSAMTLGLGVDRRIKSLSRSDMTKAAVLDACASAYLEARSDEFEKTLGDDLGYRFCPGYGGSSVEDLSYIFEILRPEKIGISLGESNFMTPAKSMAGIIAVGKKAEKSCENCFMAKNCRFLGEGGRCYTWEKK